MSLYDELLMIPGPTNLSSRIRQVLGQPQVSHVSSNFYESFLEILKLTRYVFMNETGMPFVITGGGTVGMEAAVASLIEPEDRILVLDSGFFGQRFALISEAYGAKIDVLKSETGRHIDPSLVDEKLSKNICKAVFMTHVETSTSVINPIADLVLAAKRNGVLSVVDSVCGLGGCELNFNRLGADIALTCSQKALAAPPGAALLAVSKKALDAFEARKTPIRSYYFNLLGWKSVMDDPKLYVATPAVQVLLALKEALQAVKDEGLESRWRRHHQIAEAIRAGLKALNLKFVAEDGYRANTVTAFYGPEGRVGEIQSFLLQKHGIQVAGGLSELKGKILRIGHFGNITAKDAVGVLSALEMALRSLGQDVKLGVAVEAALPHLEKLSQ